MGQDNRQTRPEDNPVILHIQATNCDECLHGPEICERFAVVDGENCTKFRGMVWAREEIAAQRVEIERFRNEVKYHRDGHHAAESRMRWRAIYYYCWIVLSVLGLAYLAGRCKLWEALPWF